MDNNYNQLYELLIRPVDSTGMLNVLINIFADKQYFHRYFKTNDDFQKLDVPWICDQLINLLYNFVGMVSISSTIPFLQNEIQCTKYTFIMFSQAVIRLVLIQEKSIEVYCEYCKNSILSLYKHEITINNGPKKKKRKKKHDTNYHQPSQRYRKVNQSQPIESLPQNQDILPDFPASLDKADSNISTCVQSTEESFISNQNLLVENIPLSENELDYLMVIDTVQHSNTEQHQSIVDQLQYSMNFPDKQIQTEQSTHTIHIQEQQVSTINDSYQYDSSSKSRKRKRSKVASTKKNKKRLIQQSKKTIRKQLKELEEKLPKRPLECTATKYVSKSMNHLPLRYAVYRKKLNLPFAAITLYTELEENQKYDFENAITMDSFKSITENQNNDNVSSDCIYQMCMNNSLPHLSLLPGLAEEYSTSKSIAWRNTMNKINKKMECSSKDIPPILEIDQEKWEKFKENMKHRVQKASLLDSETLIGSEVLRFNTDNIGNTTSPSTSTEVMLPRLLSHDKSSSQLNTNQENYVMDRFEIQNFKSTTRSVEVCHVQPNAQQMISNILQTSPEKAYCLLLNDLCPTRITNRNNAISVFVELLELHKKGLIQLSQLCNIQEPSSITISLNSDNFI